ncbi:MAG: trypsin-like peptidase domain-containing protein [Fuerstiella sp.]|nr:trypsin-like peptidase domain-containing protein [Fuerstiella sp.]MCP4858439.1 trypsin-like peptidase domain-containing protein [Fuerstiella sp.]
MKTSTNYVLIRLAACAMTVACLAGNTFADSEIYNKTLNSTAWVLAKTGGATSSGTGVLVNAQKKLLITNFHVVGDARSTVVFFPETKDGKPIVERSHYLKNVKQIGIRGRVLGVDRKRDLALVELDRLPENAVAIPLAEGSIGPGEDVQSIGNPGSTDALWVFTSGTVRSVYQKQFRTGAGEHDFRVVETQSPINSGDSGGPVVNNDGELVAISQAISPKARLVSYCVDVSELKGFLESPWKPAPLPVIDVLERTELKFTKHESGHFEVSIHQTDNDRQSVFVTKEVEYFERADVRKVWALAATLKEAPGLETMMKLLQQSARTKIGAWTVEKSENGDYLVIYCCKVDATATPDALKSTMEYVAKLTSITKKDLTPATNTKNAADTLESWLGS